MRSQHLPLSLRIKAAEGAAPYFIPRPGEARRYPCVDHHLTYIISDNPLLREALAPSTEAPAQINENAQSNSRSAPNSPQPQLETPAPENTETNFHPPTFIDYSTPPTPAELQLAADHGLEPRFCPCGHWTFGPCPLGERCRERSKLN
jgi:hypothetical protein